MAAALPPVASQPRLAVGATVSILLLACEQLGLLTEATAELSQACDQLEERSRSLSSGGGIAAGSPAGSVGPSRCSTAPAGSVPWRLAGGRRR